MSFLDDRQLFLDKLNSLCLLNDDFARIVLKDKACLEYILKTILDDKYQDIHYQTQYDIKNLKGKSVILDIFGIDGQGTMYNIEIQNDDEGAHPRRARYHEGIIDAYHSYVGEKWKDIEDMIIIFITDHDVLHVQQQICHIERRIIETGEQFLDGTKIIYVNAKYRDETTELGRMLHDFQCSDPNEMYSEVLANAMRYYKEEGGQKLMYDAFKEIRAEGITEGISIGRAEGIGIGRAEERVKNVRENITRMHELHLSLDIIAKSLGMSEDEVNHIIQSLTS